MEYNISEEYISALTTDIMKEIISKKMTLAAAESCTGGMVSSRIVDFAGASEAFVNGLVTYTNESKHRLLGVSNDTLNKYGAVSTQTAEEMCRGVSRVSGTDIGVSTTGVAGPGGGTAQKPVGLVYIGVCIQGSTATKELRLKGSRTEIRKQTVTALFEMLKEQLKKYN